MKKIITSIILGLLLVSINITNALADTWSSLNVGVGGYYTRSAIINNEIYALYGEREVYKYNITNNSFSYVTSTPISFYYGAMTEANGKLYFFGGPYSGGTPRNKLYEYNPSTNTWTQKADCPTARENASLVHYNGKLYMYGGRSGSYAKSELYEYNISTNTWTQKTGYVARIGHAAVVIGNKMYIYGGSGSTYSEGGIYEYNIATDSWTDKTSTIQAFNPSAAELNGKIYFYGGYDQNRSGQTYNKLHVFDPSTNTVTEITQPSAGPYLHGAGMVSYNGKLYILGGGEGLNNNTNIYIYDGKGSPTGVTNSTPVYSDRVTINWTDNSSFEDKFRIYVNNILKATVNSTTSATKGTPYSTTITGLTSGSVHNIKVVPYLSLENIEGNSASFNFTPLNIPSPTTTATGLSWHKTEGRGKVIFSIPKVTGAAGYRIYLTDGNSTYLIKDVTDSGGATTTWDSSNASQGLFYPAESTLDGYTNNSVSTNILKTIGTGLNLRDTPNKLYLKTVGTSLDSSNSYYFKITSYNANGETPQSSDIQVTLPNRTDSTAPYQSTIQINGGLQKTGTSEVTVSVDGIDTLVSNYTADTTDDASGVKTIELSNDGSSWSAPENYTTGFSKAWTLESGPGTKKVYARITDNAGNQFVTTSSIYLADDVTPPAVNLLFNNGQTVTSEAAGTLTINAVDDYSDLLQLGMQVSSDGITWKGYNGSTWLDNYIGQYRATVPWSLSTGDGWKNIFVKVIDAQGNYTIKSIRVALSSPASAASGTPGTSSTTSITSINGVDYQVLNNSQVQVVISGGSNISEISWSFDGLNFGSFEAPLISSRDIIKDFTFTGGDGVKAIYFKYRNQYSQESPVNSLKFVVDTTPPEVKLTTAKGQTEGATTQSSINLFVDVKDNLSKNFEYSLDGGAWTNLPANGIIIKSGLTAGAKGTLYLVRVKVKDEAGNITEKSIKVYRLP